ncbi:MAG: hydroxyethylthiazole kinase [Synergistaceae bacterium]|nr:hydroxyethylthiazole kinase [Synergistaceae bacterium]
MVRPLIYQITNAVSAQLQADCVALLGGTSIMSRQLAEAAEIAGAADALLINIGTPPDDAAELYRAAAGAAAETGRPIVLDLVGYGFSKYRSSIADALLANFRFSVIKGNEAEISALCRGGDIPRGVSCEGEIDDAARLTEECAKKYNCVVYATGEIDSISDGKESFTIGGGSPLLRRTSGIGCALGSATALFCAREKPLEASRRALALFRRAAAEAARRADGAYSFRTRFMDMLAESAAEETEGK